MWRQPGNPYTVREQHLRRYLGWPTELSSDRNGATEVSYVDDARRASRFVAGPERTFLQEIVDWIYADDGHDLGRIYEGNDRYSSDELEALKGDPDTASEDLVRSYQVVVDVALLDGTSPRIDADQFHILGDSPATGVPTIGGTAEVGQMLTADMSGTFDADGLTNVSYSYQWVRHDGIDGADIAGATTSNYTLVDDDEGKTIKVRVTFTDDRGNDETLTSAPTGEVAARTSAGSIWSATMTAAELLQGYGYSNTNGTPDGSLTSPSFEIDGVTYTVRLIEASGWLYIGLDKEVPVDFTLDVDGTRLDSSDASFTSYTYAKGYYWADAGITWSEGTTVELALNDSS